MQFAPRAQHIASAHPASRGISCIIYHRLKRCGGPYWLLKPVSTSSCDVLLPLLVFGILRQRWKGLRIVLIGTMSALIMLLVEMLGVLLRMALCLFAIDVVQALCLDKLVDLGARNADEELLGELVGDGLA